MTRPPATTPSRRRAVRSPSLADVAALAGVSSGTASRALSRPDMISADTRARVQSAADRLGYVANGAARALAMRRTMTVGAIVPRFGGSSFPAMVQGLEGVLAADGYTLLLAAPERRHTQEAAILRTMLERGVDAVALLGTEHPREVFGLLESSHTPFVMMWAAGSSEGPCIGFDEHDAAAALVRHLAGLGHRTLGFIGGSTTDNERARRRFAGLVRAVASHGLELLEDAVIETEYGFREGFEAMEELLRRAVPASAILCGNDYLAAGALSRLDLAGVAVPLEMSVASFNDNDFAPYLHPPLTTVRLPIREMGEHAAVHLLGQIRGDATAPGTMLPTALVPRASTGPAAATPALRSRPRRSRRSGSG